MNYRQLIATYIPILFILYTVALIKSHYWLLQSALDFVLRSRKPRRADGHGSDFSFVCPRQCTFRWPLIVSLSMLQCIFTGCGSSPDPKDIVNLYRPKPMPQNVQSRVGRQPGSLWGDESRWNEIFSKATSHRTGDLLLVNIEEFFKSKVLSRIPDDPEEKQKELEKEEERLKEDQKKAKQLAEEKEKAKAKESSAGKEGEKVALNGEPKDEKKDKEKEAAPEPKKELLPQDTKVLEVTIQEIKPRGLYRIYGSQFMNIGKKEALVTFEGDVRDRDVSAEETLSSDLIFNLKMEVLPKPKGEG